MNIHTFIESLSFLETEETKQIIKDRFKKDPIKKPIKEEIPKRRALKEKNVIRKTNKQISSIIGSLLLPNESTLIKFSQKKEKVLKVKNLKRIENKEIKGQLYIELSYLNLDKTLIDKYILKYLTYKNRILLKKKEFTISITDYYNLLHNSICTYCGESSTTLDRIDSRIGYTLENCTPCCKLCNTMKWDLSIQDFYSHIDKIHNYKLKPL